jgi:recombination protein RecA
MSKEHSPDAEQNRRRAIHLKLGRMTEHGPEVVPTGLAPLDAALGVGGLPRGRIIEIFGPPGCGKSTLALQIIARVQRSGGVAAWIDADGSFDPMRAGALGVSVERLAIVQPSAAEHAVEIACRLAASRAIDLLVIDSVAALVPALELAGQIGESGPGLHARVLASGLRKLSVAAARADMAALCINQTFDAEERSAGGSGLKLYAAVRIALRPEAGRRRVTLRILKNKVATAFTHCELEWRDGAGFTETP